MFIVRISAEKLNMKSHTTAAILFSLIASVSRVLSEYLTAPCMSHLAMILVHIFPRYVYRELAQCFVFVVFITIASEPVPVKQHGGCGYMKQVSRTWISKYIP